MQQSATTHQQAAPDFTRDGLAARSHAQSAALMRMHIPSPDSDPDKGPERETPNPTVPPDMEPVVPQQDPPYPGRPGDGEPPAIIASTH